MRFLPVIVLCVWSSVATAQVASPRVADPCKLLTQAEASELLGVPVSPAQLKQEGIATRCYFRGSSNSNQDVILDVHNATAPETDASVFEGMTHMPDVQRVPGIGDQALWSHSNFGGFLDIFKNKKLVIVGLPGTIASVTPAVAKAGKLIASRM